MAACLQKAKIICAVSHLATSNVPASTQESNHIREVLFNIDRETYNLHTQMQIISQRLQELNSERSYFQPMVSPLRRLPPEILGEIFGHVLDGPDRLRQQGQLANMCRVCKSWRQVAHDIPRFWCTISINPSKPTLPFEAVSSWIARSKNLPKTVHISAQACGEIVRYGYDTRKLCRGEVCPFSRPVLAQVLKDGPPLNAVSMDCPSAECFQQLSDSLQRFKSSRQPSGWDTANIITISAKWGNQWVNLPPPVWLFLPQSTGTLQLTLPTVYVVGNEVTRRSLDIDIPATVLQRLTTLKLTCDWSANHILKLLQRCKSLEALSLDMAFGNFGLWDADNTFMQGIFENGVALPTLRTLSLDGVNPSNARDLLILKHPAVRDLTIMFGFHLWVLEARAFPAPPSILNVMTRGYGTSFATFLRGSTRSPSLLESLTITNGIFQEDTLFNALKDLVSLKHLKLDNLVFNVDTFAKILSGNFLPRLQTLALLRLHRGSNNIVGIEDLFKQRRLKISMSRCMATRCGCQVLAAR